MSLCEEFELGSIAMSQGGECFWLRWRFSWVKVGFERENVQSAVSVRSQVDVAADDRRQLFAGSGPAVSAPWLPTSRLRNVLVLSKHMPFL